MSSSPNTSDNIYVNLSQANSSNKSVQCTTRNTYSVAVVDDASQYLLEIWRFILPLSQLPIFIAQPLTYDNPYYTGTVQVGSSTTSIILDSNANSVDNNFYQTSDVLINGEYRAVQSYTASTKTLIVSPAFSSSPVGKQVQICNKDYNRLKYSVTMSFDGVSYQRYLMYIANSSVSNGVIIQPTNFSLTHPGPNSLELPYYYVNSYEVFIHLINNAILYTYNELAGSPPASPPYIQYDSKSQLISIYAIPDYSTDSKVNIALNVNSYLQPFLTSFVMYHLNDGDPFGNDYQFIVIGTGNNYYIPDSSISGINGFPSYYLDSKSAAFAAPAFFIVNSEEYNSLYYWNSFRAIIFKSTLLPINQEVIPNTVISSQTQYNSILTDFEVSVQNAGDAKSYAQFFPQGPLRSIDLQSNLPVKQIDISVYWTDIFGNQFPFYLPPNSSWDIKLGFRKKIYRYTSNQPQENKSISIPQMLVSDNTFSKLPRKYQ